MSNPGFSPPTNPVKLPFDKTSNRETPETNLTTDSYKVKSTNLEIRAASAFTQGAAKINQTSDLTA
jgi:hypothetical protein